MEEAMGQMGLDADREAEGQGSEGMARGTERAERAERAAAARAAAAAARCAKAGGFSLSGAESRDLEAQMAAAFRPYPYPYPSPCPYP